MPPSDDPLTRLRAIAAVAVTGVAIVDAEELRFALAELDRLRADGAEFLRASDDLVKSLRADNDLLRGELSRVLLTIAHEALTESGVQRAAR